MNTHLLRGLTLLGAVLVLGALNFSILGKERIKRDGELVYLALAPVDPRSLIQGDYMALRFELVVALEQQRRGAEPDGTPAAPTAAAPAPDPLPDGATGFAPISLDDQRVAHLATPPATAPLKLRYRIRDGAVWLGTNAFFFEEGSAERFNAARYGEFRVDRESGEAVLVGLRGPNLQPL